MENIFVEFLPPWVETGLQPAFYDKESGSVLQQTARMYARVNMLIRMFNKLSKNTKDEVERFEASVNETVDEYIEKFNQLHDYVHDYFDNLDVQEEINNKLDQMAEDGTLSEIINQYLQSNVAWVFDTVAEMTQAPNLQDGSYARTIGYNTKTDNGGCLYYIRSKTPADEPNGSTIIEIGETLVAELVYTNDYLPINYTHVRYQGGADRRTDVWYAIIPSDFEPDLYLANNTLNTVEEPSSNAKNNMTTLTINAGVGTGADYSEPIGVVIKDGVTIKDNSGNTDAHAVLLMDNNGVLKTLPGSSTTSAIEALEPKWAVCGWWPIIADGNDYSGDHDPADYKPRTFIGQDANGDYLVAVCAGRQYTNPGLSAVDMKNFVTSVGFTPVFLYSLDGGGSSVMINKGKRVNKLDNFENRSCATFIGFKSKHTSNKSIFEQAYIENITTIEEYIDNFKPKEQKGFLTLSQAATDAGFSLSGTSTISIVGDLVNINMEFTTTDTLARYATIYDNFPPATTTYLQTPVFDVEHSVVNYIYIQNGKLSVNGSNALLAGKYHCNLTYKLKYNG